MENCFLTLRKVEYNLNISLLRNIFQSILHFREPRLPLRIVAFLASNFDDGLFRGFDVRMMNYLTRFVQVNFRFAVWDFRRNQSLKNSPLRNRPSNAFIKFINYLVIIILQQSIEWFYYASFLICKLILLFQDTVENKICRKFTM